MSVVSLARTAGVTGESSKSRSRNVSAWFELADMSMMSTCAWRVISRIWSRYSSSVLNRTSPAWSSGDFPGAPSPVAMSASLASARMNSRQLGSAWIAASLRSSDLIISAASPAVAVPQAGDGHPRPASEVPRSSRAHRHADLPWARGLWRSRSCHRRRVGLAGRLGVALQHLVDRLAEDLSRVLQRRDLLGPDLDLELGLHSPAADDGRDRDADVAHAVDAADER